MTKRLGLALDLGEIRAVWLRSGRIRWRRRLALSDSRALSDVLSQLLADAPESVAGARVSVALSAPWVHLKRLQGIPDLKSHQLASQLVRENPQAFFLWKRGVGVVSEVHRTADGTQWGAGFDGALLQELVTATRATRTILTRVLPAPIAVATAFPSAKQDWGVRVQLPEGVHEILGADMEYLDAYAAAAAPRRLPLAWRPGADPHRAYVMRRVGQTSAVLAFAAAAAFAALAPGLRAAQFARRFRTELTSAQPLKHELERHESDLQGITKTLDRVSMLTADRGSITRILASLTEAIPESTALLTFHVDSSEGAFTAVAPHVTDVLPLLESVEEISGARIVGSVTPEVISGVRVQRAAFRFRRAGTVRALRSKPSTR